MLSRFGSWTSFTIALAMLCVTTGCVERRMIIDPRPVGAIVYDEKDQPIGAGPVDKVFTYYGEYRFRIAKDGYETLVYTQRVRAPWYELPGLDFIAENLIPWTIRDVHRFYPVLQPAQVVPPEDVLRQGQLLREFGRTIGVPIPVLNPPVVGPTVGDKVTN
ncbi:MAG: hypothetical protein EXR98_19240 [Gemmataceae bacterium]|nr:hypothetical protein [Gemmataceae bacterium]